MKTYILIACDRHDETPLMAAHSEAKLAHYAESLGDEYWDEFMYGWRIAEVDTLQTSKRIELVAAVLVGVAAAFALRHRFSHPGLTETQLLVDACPVYAGLVGGFAVLMVWGAKR